MIWHRGVAHQCTSFAAAGPRAWNELPFNLRDTALSLAVFNAHLKTHLFSISCGATAHLWHLWLICAAYKCTYLLTYLLTYDHASTPPLSFLQAVCPSCRPTNSIKALKAIEYITVHTVWALPINRWTDSMWVSDTTPPNVLPSWLTTSVNTTSDRRQGLDLQNILWWSYDKARVTIDFRWTSGLQNILHMIQGFS